MATLNQSEFLDDLADEHRVWLSRFDSRYLKKWEQLRRNNFEAAMTEAAVRWLLEEHGIRVAPNESLDGSKRSPDFRCSKDGAEFYVEVTCITLENAIRKTGVDDSPTEFSPFTPLNDPIFEKCLGKESQCRDLDLPVLLAIGTFHSTAASVSFRREFAQMLLTGTTRIAWHVNVQGGEPIGETFETTGLCSAAFLKSEDGREINPALRSISGLLLCGIGSYPYPAVVVGVLHPFPIHQFNRGLLPGVEFGEIEVERLTGQLRVRWSAVS
jgi:hypothetical protein